MSLSERDRSAQKRPNSVVGLCETEGVALGRSKSLPLVSIGGKSGLHPCSQIPFPLSVSRIEPARMRLLFAFSYGPRWPESRHDMPISMNHIRAPGANSLQAGPSP